MPMVSQSWLQPKAQPVCSGVGLTLNTEEQHSFLSALGRSITKRMFHTVGGHDPFSSRQLGTWLQQQQAATKL